MRQKREIGGILRKRSLLYAVKRKMEPPAGSQSKEGLSFALSRQTSIIKKTAQESPSREAITEVRVSRDFFSLTFQAHPNYKGEDT